uniref:Uncharacterized protein n=1 Tax=Rhodnius prolixus TaxID=13249 RepID=T1HIK7_RHOPR
MKLLLIATIALVCCLYAAQADQFGTGREDTNRRSPDDFPDFIGMATKNLAEDEKDWSDAANLHSVIGRRSRLIPGIVPGNVSRQIISKSGLNISAGGEKLPTGNTLAGVSCITGAGHEANSVSIVVEDDLESFWRQDFEQENLYRMEESQRIFYI